MEKLELYHSNSESPNIFNSMCIPPNKYADAESPVGMHNISHCFLCQQLEISWMPITVKWFNASWQTSAIIYESNYEITSCSYMEQHRWLSICYFEWKNTDTGTHVHNVLVCVCMCVLETAKASLVSESKLMVKFREGG